MPVIFIKRNEELTVTEFCNLGPFLALKADDRVWLAGNFDKARVTSVCHYALLRKACEAVQSWLGIRDVRGKAAVTWASKGTGSGYHSSAHRCPEVRTARAGTGDASVQRRADMPRLPVSSTNSD